MKKLEEFGGICDCQSTRDTFLYAASVDSRGLEATIEILGDVVLRPQITGTYYISTFLSVKDWTVILKIQHLISLIHLFRILKLF